MPVRLIIADDHPLLVDGLRKVLGEMSELEVLEPVGDGRQLLTRLRQAPIDMVLLDLHMPKADGVETLKVIRKEFPQLKVLVFTSYNQPRLLREIRELGAKGLLLKSNDSVALKEAVRVVAGGGIWFPEEGEAVTGGKFLDEFMKKYQVTQREVEVLRMIAEGYTSKEIGKRLFVSEFTINAHRRNICRKLGVSTPAGLVRFAREHGLVGG
ncbi:MAG: response regulator transcription factor [Bacteroidetes bacterium]|nr:response regulator transcription factor [Bacteroidota bacterium]